MYQKIFSFIIILLISCGKSENNDRTINFSKDQDFRIINFFNEQKHTELTQRLLNAVKANAESEDSYAFYS